MDKTIEKIVNIPRDFHRRKTISPITLLDESGYLKFHDGIREEAIIEVLKKHPHLIKDWLQWSDDKRYSPTWFFTRGDDGWCFVGHFPESREFEEINTKDEFYACAAFIKRDLERIRITFL